MQRISFQMCVIADFIVDILTSPAVRLCCPLKFKVVKLSRCVVFYLFQITMIVYQFMKKIVNVFFC